MHNIAVSSIYKQHTTNNFLFDNLNAEIGEDLFAPFHVLKRIGAINNFDFRTHDLFAGTKIDGYIFLDMPDLSDSVFLEALQNNSLKYLLIFESVLTRWQNYNHEFFKYFDKIFTYNDDYVDNDFFIKIYYSMIRPELDKINLSPTDSKLCTMISSNKKSTHNEELYSERMKIIDWFEINAPNEFDLYGGEWDMYTFNNVFPLKYLNKFKYLRKVLAKNRNVYKGKVTKKSTVLNNYKFSICYENAKNINGYITEKIFDSMKSGCIPVYLGAPNIQSFIPQNCFIDARKFKDPSELYAFLKEMPEVMRNSYFSSIIEFLSSKESEKFYVEHFAETIINSLISDIGKK